MFQSQAAPYHIFIPQTSKISASLLFLNAGEYAHNECIDPAYFLDYFNEYDLYVELI